MWSHSALECLNLSSFRSRTPRGRCPPTRKSYLEPLEGRTLLSDVHALFDPVDLDRASLGTRSPFPSDRFTVADNTQNTGRHVNLPLPDPATNPSDYQDTQVINTLDGFNLQPRLTIPFDGPIDVNSVNSQDVFLVSLGDTLPGGDPGGEVVGINQVVWDPDTNTLHVESDELLDQHTRYALIVTNAVLDAGGDPVEAEGAFRLAPLTLLSSRDPALRSYGLELAAGLEAAYRRAGVPPQDIVTASVFTTQSATAVLEKIHDQIHAAPKPKANFNVGLNGERTVFNLNDVQTITFNRQTQVNGVPTPDPTIPTIMELLGVIPGAVGQIAYGKYASPDYEVHPGEYIPPVGTRTGRPTVQGSNDIYFTLVLPSVPEPEGGWPVAILGHGANSNKDGIYGVPAAAATMAANGIATIGINTVGFGFGPGGTITVTQRQSGDSVILPAGGRGIDQNGDGEIGNSEGFLAASPQAIISERDGRIQTDADLMQLVRVIEAGVDVDGNRVADLNPSRVYYDGVSLGGMIGASFLAVEPDVSTGALGVLGGATIERLRLGATRGGAGVVAGLTAANVLASRTPSLINAPGVISLDGLPVSAPYFNENMPLRDGVPLDVRLADGTTRTIVSPVTNTVAGAMAIQEVFDNREWVSQSGDPVAYAPHLRKDPLPGVPAKSIIVQFAKGDPLAVNPSTTAFLRAGGLADRATFYRYDLAFPGQLPNQRPSLAYPHTFEALITSLIPTTGDTDVTIRDVALAAQEQFATFFATDGTQIIQPPGVPAEYFEVGMKESELPEGLNFTIPPSAPAAAPALVSGSLASGPIPMGAASDKLVGEPLGWSPTATSVPAGTRLLPTVMSTSGWTSAARTVPQAARAVPVPLAGLSAMPITPLIDTALDALPPLARFESALDDLAAGLLRPARRRR